MTVDVTAEVTKTASARMCHDGKQAIIIAQHRIFLWRQVFWIQDFMEIKNWREGQCSVDLLQRIFLAQAFQMNV